jgi:hypothetical protein
MMTVIVVTIDFNDNVYYELVPFAESIWLLTQSFIKIKGGTVIRCTLMRMRYFTYVSSY